MTMAGSTSRRRVRWTLKSTVSYLMHSIVFDAVTAVGLAIFLAGGLSISWVSRRFISRLSSDLAWRRRD
jgi:hypothetical protein